MDSYIKKPVSELRLWDKNPRSINETDFNRLKDQITLLGQYKPLLVTDENVVIGGNMRLRALQELKVPEVYVSVIEFIEDGGLWYGVIGGEKQQKGFPDKLSGMTEYALSDNDRAGRYDSDSLANLLGEVNIDETAYSIDLGSPKTIDQLLEGSDTEKVEGEEKFTEELMESHNYVVLYFDNEMDWLNLQTLYPLETVNALDSKDGFEKKGVGRVVKGTDFLNKIRNV